MKKFIIILYLLHSGITIYSQQKIKFNYYKSNVPKEVIFTNNKIFDIGANNPFLLNLPIEYEKDNYVCYNIGKLNNSQIINLFPSLKIRDNLEFNEVYWTRAVTYPIPCEYSTNYFAISYILLLYDLRDALFGCVSNVYVYDSTGKEVFTKENLLLDAYDIMITDNGKYLAYVFGEDYDDSFGKIVTPGINVYNIENGELIDEILDTSQDTQIIGIASHKNIISLNINNPNKKENIIYYYHSNNDKRYDIVLTHYKYWSIKEITNEGLIFSSGKNKSLMKFDKYFNSEDLK